MLGIIIAAMSQKLLSGCFIIILIRITGFKLKQCLSASVGNYKQYTIKFNQDLVLAFNLTPNGYCRESKGILFVHAKIKWMSAKIEYVTLSFL